MSSECGDYQEYGARLHSLGLTGRPPSSLAHTTQCNPTWAWTNDNSCVIARRESAGLCSNTCVAPPTSSPTTTTVDAQREVMRSALVNCFRCCATNRPRSRPDHRADGERTPEVGRVCRRWIADMQHVGWESGVVRAREFGRFEEQSLCAGTNTAALGVQAACLRYSADASYFMSFETAQSTFSPRKSP